ncbi:MAG: TetR/AcrR family transcriptional regulator [Lachnospiraceae bacterium]|nr:TetR/AcrR family transcriptional regulator [Lachnospiraceae bacterium]
MARYTEKLILGKFEEMLEVMPFDKITVSALAKNCDISPNTFYYHYKDIYELLEHWFNITTQQFLGSRPQGEPWDETIKAVLKTLQQRPNIVYNVYDSLSRENLERYVFKSAEGAFFKLAQNKTDGFDIDPEMLRTISDICCYAVLGFFLKFIWSHMSLDIDKSINQISTAINTAIEMYIASALAGIDILG